MNWCSFDGNPPLWETVMKDNAEFIQMLLSKGICMLTWLILWDYELEHIA
jgi:hypothetical protein